MSSELALGIRWPKYWSFSFRVSPSSEYSGLTSPRIDWVGLAVPGTLKSLLQHHSLNACLSPRDPLCRQQGEPGDAPDPAGLPAGPAGAGPGETLLRLAVCGPRGRVPQLRSGAKEGEVLGGCLKEAAGLLPGSPGSALPPPGRVGTLTLASQIFLPHPEGGMEEAASLGTSPRSPHPWQSLPPGSPRIQTNL